MKIISISSVQPQTTISNELLMELGAQEEEVSISGVAFRNTVLSHEYILRTKNKQPQATLSVASHSPTDLGVEALRLALEEAGVAVEEVGLLVADTSSQLQTIPCESQRIANALGVKLPCYDFALSSAAFANHLKTFQSWKKQKLPAFIACVWVHTPTRFIDYGQGCERLAFGDGASAAILATGDVGTGYRVTNVEVSSRLELADAVSLSLFGQLAYDFSKMEVATLECLRTHLLRRPPTSNEYFVVPYLWQQRVSFLEQEWGILPERILSVVEDGGYCLGAYPGVVLARKRNLIDPGATVRVWVADAGFTFGEVLLVRDV